MGARGDRGPHRKKASKPGENFCLLPSCCSGACHPWRYGAPRNRGARSSSRSRPVMPRASPLRGCPQLPLVPAKRGTKPPPSLSPVPLQPHGDILDCGDQHLRTLQPPKTSSCPLLPSWQAARRGFAVPAPHPGPGLERGGGRIKFWAFWVQTAAAALQLLPRWHSPAVPRARRARSRCRELNYSAAARPCG